MSWRPIDVAALYLGRKEVIGPKSDPAILAMLRLDARWPEDDSVPWCSAFVNWCAYHAGYQRSSGPLALRARAWIGVGQQVWTRFDRSVSDPSAEMLKIGDVIIFSRGRWAPGPEVIGAPGHVGFWTGELSTSRGKDSIACLGGNQGDAVSIRSYPMSRLIAVRRLRRDNASGFGPG